MEKTIDKSIMSVKLDWTFKELMLKEEIRNRFIEAVLKVKINSSIILNTFHIRNDKTNKLYTDKMGFYILELPKIPKEVENINDLVLWCTMV